MQEPTFRELAEYLHYQHPSTKGDIELNKFCEHVAQLTESNRQLREELERVKTFAKEEHDIVQRVWKALGKETYRESKPHTTWEWVELQRVALAAAKEALESCDILSIVPFSTWLVANALARIAECEKGT